MLGCLHTGEIFLDSVLDTNLAPPPPKDCSGAVALLSLYQPRLNACSHKENRKRLHRLDQEKSLRKTLHKCLQYIDFQVRVNVESTVNTEKSETDNKTIVFNCPFHWHLLVSGLIQKLMDLIQMIILSQFQQRRYERHYYQKLMP